MEIIGIRNFFTSINNKEIIARIETAKIITWVSIIKRIILIYNKLIINFEATTSSMPLQKCILSFLSHFTISFFVLKNFSSTVYYLFSVAISTAIVFFFY
jgi:RsiW-degrading membrane proteinase PrsW (M82 family)